MAKSLKKQNKICVFYPCTQKELESGSLYQSIVKIISKTPSEKYSFDLFLIFDNLPESNSNLTKILDLGNTVYLNKIYTHSLNLSGSDNLYIKHWDSRSSLPEIIPPHGLSSGPNNSFYQSLYYLLSHPNRYQYTLLLETDIQILKAKWLDYILNFCNSNEFSIAGSKYKGIQKWHRVLDYKDHLNGIAIYNLNQDLYKILKSSEEHLIKSVKSGVPFINFDIAIDEWRRSEEGSHFFNSSNKLIDTKFITNASDPEDASLSMFKVLTHYPDTIILHHKTNSDNFSFTSKASLDAIDYLDPKIELIKKYVEENNIDRIQDFVMKSVVNKSGQKVNIITNIDRKLPLEDIAKSQNKKIEDLINEIENIVASGTKINLDYHLNTILDEEAQKEIYDYFLEDAETDNVQEAFDEFEGDYSEEELRLMKIKFMSEMAN